MADRPRRRKKQTVPGSDFTQAEVDTAELLRNVYNIERRRHLNNQNVQAKAYDPNSWEDNIESDKDTGENAEDETASKKSNEWLELAKRVIIERLDPETFIRRQFQVTPSNGRPPWARELNSPQAFTNYEAGASSSYDEIRVAFSSQQQIATNNMVVAQADDDTAEEAWEEVLDDDDMPLSALFRYCLALSVAKKTKDERFKDIARRFRQVAALQYLQDPDSYDEIWGPEWIPAGFRARADKIYNSVYDRG